MQQAVLVLVRCVCLLCLLARFIPHPSYSHLFILSDGICLLCILMKNEMVNWRLLGVSKQGEASRLKAIRLLARPRLAMPSGQIWFGSPRSMSLSLQSTHHGQTEREAFGRPRSPKPSQVKWWFHPVQSNPTHAAWTDHRPPTAEAVYLVASIAQTSILH